MRLIQAISLHKPFRKRLHVWGGGGVIHLMTHSAHFNYSYLSSDTLLSGVSKTLNLDVGWRILILGRCRNLRGALSSILDLSLSVTRCGYFGVVVSVFVLLFVVVVVLVWGCFFWWIFGVCFVCLVLLFLGVWVFFGCGFIFIFFIFCCCCCCWFFFVGFFVCFFIKINKNVTCDINPLFT